MGEYEKVIFEYETLCPQSIKNNPELLFQIAFAYYKLNSFTKAEEYLPIILENTPTNYQKERATALQAIIKANLLQWDESISSFEQLGQFQNRQKVANANISILQSAQKIKYKNPKVAGILSIIPGAGYAYTGNKQTAILLFC